LQLAGVLSLTGVAVTVITTTTPLPTP
jgi:hypothetical protein